jgi:hypothetical protein
MTQQEIEDRLLTLSLADKAQIVQSLTKTLSMSGKGITKTPGVCGGEACIDETRISVWLLVELSGLDNLYVNFSKTIFISHTWTITTPGC